MNRINLLFFLLLAFLGLSIQALSQEQLLPLIERTKIAKGTSKIDLLNELSVEYRKTDRYEAMNYARQALKLSVEIKYLAGEALAKKNEGICWFFIGNNDSASICNTKALEIFSKAGDSKGVSACYNNLGLIAQETGKYEKALEYYQLSMDIDDKLGDETGVALTLGNMADIYMYRGDVKKAMILTNQCLEIYEKLAYKPGLLISYSNRGAEYDYLMKYDEAVDDYTATLALARELKDIYQEIMANSNLGVTYWHMGKPEMAMRYLNTALEMSDETDDAYNIDNTLLTMAQIYTSDKQYEKANEILLKVLKRTEEIDNRRQAASAMTAIGRNLIELNEIDKALGYLFKSLEITIDLDAPYEMLENYRNLAHAHAILHNFEKADSLQDLFAETYSNLLRRDSIPDAGDSVNNKNESPKIGKSTAPEWITAFLVIGFVLLLSVIAYRKK